MRERRQASEHKSSAAQTVSQTILTRERVGVLVATLLLPSLVAVLPFLLYFCSFVHLALLLCPTVSVLDEFAQRAVHFGLYIESVKTVRIIANKIAVKTLVVGYTSGICYCYSVIICNK